MYTGKIREGEVFAMTFRRHWWDREGNQHMDWCRCECKITKVEDWGLEWVHRRTLEVHQQCPEERLENLVPPWGGMVREWLLKHGTYLEG